MRQLGMEEFLPEMVMSDFEMGIINAATQHLRFTLISLCFFHLKQSMYRHVQSEGLATAYNDPIDRSLKLFIHQLAALAFVPVRDVKKVFVLLKNEAPEIAHGFVTYFETTYVGIEEEPRYAIRLWNHYDAVLEDRDTTNNASEGWHNRFQTIVNKHHPDLYSALHEFQKEQADTEIGLIELAQGKSIKAAPKKQWLLLKQQLKAMVGTYQNIYNQCQNRRRGQAQREREQIQYVTNIANFIVMS